MEKTILLIKPDGVQRRLVGEIIARLERKGLLLVGAKMMRLTDALLRDHYKHHVEKPFFPEIASFMKSAPIVATCWAGLDAVATVRAMAGITKARDALPGTIRGDLAMSIQANVVHASDSVESAQDEIQRFFQPGELLDYRHANEAFVYSAGEQKTL